MSLITPQSLEAMLDFVPPPDVPREVRPREVRVYTLDFETDPFRYGRYPQPFAACLYDGEKPATFWGPGCEHSLMTHVATLPPGIIYAHNGGKFDFYFLFKYLRGYPALLINRRIVRTYVRSKVAKPHELRDSYSIMPFALGRYKKDEIDYRLFEPETREAHREEIVTYLENDCIYLYELCSAFLGMFGPKITVGQASMGELRKLHTFERINEPTDFQIRSKYYYGGRVEAIQKGVLRPEVRLRPQDRGASPALWNVYDVNSMYPHVMKSFQHPIGNPTDQGKRVRASTYFLSVEGRNYGAFPVRTKQGLRFDVESGLFHVGIHEYQAALETGMFEPTRIRTCLNFSLHDNFAAFVDKFHSLRLEAKAQGDDLHSLFYKYVLNSCYGKFAQDSSKYLEYMITEDGIKFDKASGWREYQVDEVTEGSHYIIWGRKPQNLRGEDLPVRMYNIATAASITSASRSIMIRAIAKADTPIYCDTDSLICRSLDVPQDPSQLGAWKLEATAHTACIAGKKLYALYGTQCMDCKGSFEAPRLVKKWYGVELCDHHFHTDHCVKQANKGVEITAEEIKRVCEGEVIETSRDAPSFKLNGKHTFITRRVRMT